MNTIEINKDQVATYLIDCIGYSESDVESLTLKELIELAYENNRNEFINYISN